MNNNFINCETNKHRFYFDMKKLDIARSYYLHCIEEGTVQTLDMPDVTMPGNRRLTNDIK